MLVSPPPRFQFEGVPFVWSRLMPSSNEGFTQKLPNSRFGTGERATDKSSMTITPVMAWPPPDTREQRIFPAPSGTANDPFRCVNVESAMVLTQPGLLVPLVTKWICPTTLSAALKNSTLKRISGPLMLYISYHWIANVSPG